MKYLHIHADNSDCEYGWKAFGGSCYKFVMGNDKTWGDAMLYCTNEAHRAHLVTIDDGAEFRFVTKQIENEILDEWMFDVGLELWWTGGRKEDQEWVWDQGENGRK